MGGIRPSRLQIRDEHIAEALQSIRHAANLRQKADHLRAVDAFG